MAPRETPLALVVGYPMVKRPFYPHPDPVRPELSNSFDLAFRYGMRRTRGFAIGLERWVARLVGATTYERRRLPARPHEASP